MGRSIVFRLDCPRREISAAQPALYGIYATLTLLAPAAPNPQKNNISIKFLLNPAKLLINPPVRSYFTYKAESFSLLRKAAPGKAIIMQTNNTVRLLSFAALTLLTGAAGAQAPTYQITDLGSLSNGFSRAYALNNLGQVVGSSVTADGRQHPFLYSNGVMQDLGSLSTVPLRPSQESGLARGINDSGQIIGQTNDSTGALRGFHYANGMLQPLDTAGNPQGINNAGQIVGFGSHALLSQNGQTTDLGTLNGGTSVARAINNSGQIVGSTANTSGYGRAFIYQNGQMQDLGLPTGAFSAEALGISNNSEVVGSYNDSDGFGRACSWQNGQITTLGAFARFTNSDAFGVNSSGVVVGVAPVEMAGQQAAFVYQNGQVYDLFAGTSWVGGAPYAINDAGQIVGYGYRNGIQHAFLATPNAVPAPGSLLTFGVGMGVLLLAARRRKRA